MRKKHKARVRSLAKTPTKKLTIKEALTQLSEVKQENLLIKLRINTLLDVLNLKQDRIRKLAEELVMEGSKKYAADAAFVIAEIGNDFDARQRRYETTGKDPRRQIFRMQD